MIVGSILGYYVRQNIAKRRAGTLEAKMQKRLVDVKEETTAMVKKAEARSSEIIEKAQTETDERRREFLKAQQLLLNRESLLNTRIASFEEKDKELQEKGEKLKSIKEELEKLRSKAEEKLEKVADLSREDAKKELMELVEIEKEKEILERIRAELESGKSARQIALTDEEKKLIKSLSLLTLKPIIYALNTDNDAPVDTSKWDGQIIKINAKIEEEIANLKEDEQKEFLRELGIAERGLDKLIRASYELLGLITFFTTGPDETRAWTVKKGSKAPQAAGVIHTDFEKGFVRAEVMDYKKFLEAGSETAAREKGWIRTEGKEYVIQDGDICNFLINK